MLNVEMRVGFTTRETCPTLCSPQPRASSEDSLSGERILAQRLKNISICVECP